MDNLVQILKDVQILRESYFLRDINNIC